MRSALLALVLALFAASAHGQTVPVSPAQLPTYVKTVANKVNEHTATLKALRDEVQLLKLANDILVRAIVVQVCIGNEKAAGWVGILPGVEPIKFSRLQCPTNPRQARWLEPIYLLPDSPPIPQ